MAWDMKNKKIDIGIIHGISGDQADELNNLVSKYNFITRIDALAGNDGIFHSIEFLQCHVTDHKVEFDYAKSESIQHNVTIEYKSFQILTPNNS